MRSAMTTMFLLAAGCASEPPSPSAEALDVEEVSIHEIADDAPPGSDTPPAIDVTLRSPDGDEVTRRVIAAERFAGRVVVVFGDRRLVALGSPERVLAAEISGVPLADENRERLVWTVPNADGVSYDVRMIDDLDAEPRTIACASGPMSPIAWFADRIVYVGSVNGGVAGLWLGPASEGALACVTNCELRAGQPWGDRYVPPPGEGGSIRIDGARVAYVAGDGSERTAVLPGSAP